MSKVKGMNIYVRYYFIASFLFNMSNFRIGNKKR